jgi:hypothetical protein
MENPDALGYPQAAAAPEIAPSGFTGMNLKGALGISRPPISYTAS